MEAAARELMSLQLESHKPLVQDGRRMSVIALAFTLKSVTQLAEMVFDSELLGQRVDFRQVAKLHARTQMSTWVHGCSERTAPRLSNASATGLLAYALPLVPLENSNWQQLEGNHCKACCTCLGLPRDLQRHKTLVAVGVWTLEVTAGQWP